MAWPLNDLTGNTSEEDNNKSNSDDLDKLKKFKNLKKEDPKAADLIERNAKRATKAATEFDKLTKKAMSDMLLEVSGMGSFEVNEVIKEEDAKYVGMAVALLSLIEERFSGAGEMMGLKGKELHTIKIFTVSKILKEVMESEKFKEL